MTTLLKNASYLRVAHAGQTTGSLFLADLADEENALQNRKIPVYVPEGGSITLPLDEDVLLSYQQGTIRGLEDQGYLTTTLLEQPNLKAEIWISPDGDDTNAGTREAPYATIQQAVDDLYDRHGADVRKTVKLLPGTYEENVVVNQPRYTFKGVEGLIDQIRWESTDTRPALTGTNITKAEVEDYYSNDGPQFTANPSAGTFTWDGPTLANREFAEGLDGTDDMHWSFENITFIAGPNATTIPNHGLAVHLFSGRRDDGNGDLRHVDFINCLIGYGLNNVGAYFKNIRFFTFKSAMTYADVVFDRCETTEIQRPDLRMDTKGRKVIVVHDKSATADQPEQVINLTAILEGFEPKEAEEVEFYFQSAGDLTVDSPSIEVQDNITIAGAGGIGTSSNLLKRFVAGNAVNFRTSGTVSLEEVLCNSIDKSGSGNLLLGRVSCSGNVTISAGTTNEIRGGTIEGNLTVDGAANIDFTNVVVKGDVTINSGGGTVTWSGGSFYGTLTDPDSKLGGAVSGSYLNV